MFHGKNYKNISWENYNNISWENDRNIMGKLQCCQGEGLVFLEVGLGMGGLLSCTPLKNLTMMVMMKMMLMMVMNYDDGDDYGDDVDGDDDDDDNGREDANTWYPSIISIL